MNEHDEVANIVADKMEEFIRNKFTVNKLTDAEIVKSLESLLDRMRAYESLQASIGKGLVEDIISMYNRQKAEIERLTVENLKMVASIKNLKSEAIKEFSEKLKCRSHRFKTIDRIFVDCIPLDYIDNLVREMNEQTTLTKIEHNSLCETETYKGGV